MFMYFMHMCMPKCICTYNMSIGASRDQKRGLDPLELELQAVVNHHMDAGNQSQALYKSSLNH